MDARHFSRHLEAQPLPESERRASLDYRRWAFESAALDLALRQAGRSLGDAVGRDPRPVTFVASGGLGDPPTTARLRAFLASTPVFGSSSTLAPTGRTPSSPSFGARWSTRSTSRASTAARSSTTRPTPPLSARDRGVPGRVARGPGAHGRDDAGPRAPGGQVTWDAPIHAVEDIQASAGRRARST